MVGGIYVHLGAVSRGKSGVLYGVVSLSFKTHEVSSALRILGGKPLRNLARGEGEGGATGRGRDIGARTNYCGGGDTDQQNCKDANARPLGWRGSRRVRKRIGACHPSVQLTSNRKNDCVRGLNQGSPRTVFQYNRRLPCKANRASNCARTR